MTTVATLALVLLLQGAAQDKDAPRPAPPPPPPGPTAEEIEAARQARLREGRDAILRAYRREYAFLDEEEKALQARLEAVAVERRDRIGQAETEVKAFEEKLSDLQDRIAKAKTALREQEEKAAKLREETDGTEAILSQAFASLERYGIRPLEDGALKAGTPEYRDRGLNHAFEKGAEVISGMAVLQVAAGSFFRADGTPAEGKVMKVGGVASMVVGGPLRGPLAPAGGGRMKLLSNVPPKAPLPDGTTAPVLPLFLYESAEKAVEERRVQTWQEHVTAGGQIAWVIVGLGVAASLLLLVRVGLMIFSASNARSLMERVTPSLLRGRFDEALSAARGGGAAGRVLREALARPDADSKALETLLSERILRENLKLDRFDVSVMVSAAVAPLLGLLGTVTGMIATFDVITVHGTGDPKMLSGGISEALITTELGLVVSIPLLLFGSMLNGWGDRIKSGMESVALRLVHLREGSDGSGEVVADEQRQGEEDVAPAGARG